jgi:hypothetical protein
MSQLRLIEGVAAITGLVASALLLALVVLAAAGY